MLKSNKILLCYRRIYTSLMAQILKPLGLSILSVIMIIGIVALATELIEMEEVAKTVVIPSLILLIAVTGYAMYQTYTRNSLR
jgi:hypothetical protein